MQDGEQERLLDWWCTVVSMEIIPLMRYQHDKPSSNLPSWTFHWCKERSPWWASSLWSKRERLLQFLPRRRAWEPCRTRDSWAHIQREISYFIRRGFYMISLYHTLEVTLKQNMKVLRQRLSNWKSDRLSNNPKDIPRCCFYLTEQFKHLYIVCFDDDYNNHDYKHR